ncbi:MAG TPA: M81 family metallopeptidase [Arsenicitalea sp.]|nr:M81 family metallopeptidase [Arsenicitalea sp.]
MRIAVGGLHTECSTYNPVLMREPDFTIWRGDDMLAKPYFDVLKGFEATYLPTFYARNIAGGPIERQTYERFKQEFLETLRAALPVDGVYLAMHGALFVEGMEDAEGDWISAAREVVGEKPLISVSYDLHGNLSQKIIDNIDLFSTYRTAPHIDIPETQLRSVSMLFRALQSGERPLLAWVPVPVVLPGERTSTEDEPAKSLYAQLPGMDTLPGVWDASLQVGYVWADEPRATAAAIITGTDRAVLETTIKALATSYWDARDAFSFGPKTGSIAECVAWAAASPTHPVILAESGDNPTGGGVGDRAEVLAELIGQGATGVVFAGIMDKAATDKAYAAGVGATLELTVGASLDPSSTPVTASFTVKFLLDAAKDTDREAVVSAGGIDLVLSARRRPYHNIADFKRLGLDPSTAGIVVVKSGYLSPELAPIANPNYMLLSPGVVDQDVDRLVRDRKVTPTYPFDRNFPWVPLLAYSKRSAP